MNSVFSSPVTVKMQLPCVAKDGTAQQVELTHEIPAERMNKIATDDAEAIRFARHWIQTFDLTLKNSGGRAA